MKTMLKLLVLGLTLGATTLLLAQDGPPPREGGGRGPGGPGGGGPGGQRPVPPIINALDANQDGFIDETEMKRAAEALKTLDKDGDGKVSREECFGPRPIGPGGPGGQGGQGRPPGGPGGQGGQGGQGNHPQRPPSQ